MKRRVRTPPPQENNKPAHLLPHLVLSAPAAARFTLPLPRQPFHQTYSVTKACCFSFPVFLSWTISFYFRQCFLFLFVTFVNFVMFVIADWSIFMKVALKSLSDHSNISINLVLASIDSLFLFSFEYSLWDLSQYNEWFLFKTEFGYSLMRLVLI